MKFTILDSNPPVEKLSFWQSCVWKEILVESGQVRSAFYFGNEEIAILVEVRTLGFGQRGAFALGCDLPYDTLKALLEDLKKELRNLGVLFLQIEPLSEPLEIWLESPYRSFLVPYTRTIDLTLPIEDIFKGMHEKWRYNIRLAEKRGVHIERVQPTREYLDLWYELLRETTERDSFSQNSQTYYKVFLDQIGANGWLYLAFYENHVIAASIAVFTPERAIYYYWASRSDPLLRKHMAPYLLQWQMIQDAKTYGSKLYDFLGIANPHNPNDHLRGVSNFKEKFGGSILRLPKVRIIPLSQKYYPFMAAYRLKQLLGK